MRHLFKVKTGNPGSIYNFFFVLNIKKHVRKYKHTHTHTFVLLYFTHKNYNYIFYISLKFKTIQTHTQ
jgi:hypothetical protein